MHHHYSVYILRCNDGSYYTGVTNNLPRRLEEHQDGLNLHCYTYRRRPFALMIQKDFHSIEMAIAFEKQVKGWSRKKKEAFIAGDLKLLQRLSAGYDYSPE